MLGVPYPVFTRAPLVPKAQKAEHQQSISRLPTKGARVYTGYGTPNMLSKKAINFAFLNKLEHCASVEMIIDGFAFREASVKDRKIKIKSTAM